MTELRNYRDEYFKSVTESSNKYWDDLERDHGRWRQTENNRNGDNADSGLPAVSLCDTTFTRADYDAAKSALETPLKKADEILEKGDLQSFKDLFADPAIGDDVRREFLHRGGLQKIDQAFGESSGIRGYKELVEDAGDFVQYGKVSTATEIRREQGFFGLDRNGVKNILQSMTEEEQSSYNRGKADSGVPAANFEGQKRKDLEYYYSVNSALKSASGFSAWDSSAINYPDMSQVAEWETLIKANQPLPPTLFSVCDLQKTSERVRKTEAFAGDDAAAESKLEMERNLEASRKAFLESIPETAKRAAEDGYSGVNILVLGNDSRDRYASTSYEKPQLSAWEQRVSDQIESLGMTPSIERQQVQPRYYSDRNRPSYTWNLIARW